MLIYATLGLFLGFCLDLLLGDPKGWPHAIRIIGRLIAFLEKRLYPMPDKRFAGALLVGTVLLFSTLLPTLLLWLAWQCAPWLYLLLETVFCWQLLATKSLRKESDAVYLALRDEDLPRARHALSMIVGRDTEPLDEAGLIRGAVETVAENAADGVGAPLFYLALGGAPLGFLYKAANTMDSMIGYDNDRYRDFGCCAAKLDDVLNYLPARLTAWMMLPASGLLGMDRKAACRIWRRDRRKHASPNSAQTESVMAGALGIRLAGDAWYFGRLKKKPFIGDALRPVEREDIRRSHRLLYATALLLLAAALCLRGIVYVLL